MSPYDTGGVVDLLKMLWHIVVNGDPGGPGAPNDKGGITDAQAAVSITGTWHDTHHFYLSTSTVGLVVTITTETCGVITGGSLSFTGTLNLRTLLGNGTYSGMIN
jgi:hypothetical protein